jgi:SAM-dependent methyltransferase
MNEGTPARPEDVFSPRASFYATSKVHDDPETLTWLVEAASPSATDVALDVATGTGYTALALASRISKVEAVDRTEAMLVEARKLAAQRGIANVTFRIADAMSLPFANETFDIVACRRAAHHFTDLLRALREMARVLKIGGRLIIDDRTVPDDDEVDGLINELDRLHDQSHVRDWRVCELSAMVQGTGLELMSTRPYRRRTALSHFTKMVEEPTAQRIRDLVTGSNDHVKRAIDLETSGGLVMDNFFVLLTAVKAR